MSTPVPEGRGSRTLNLVNLAVRLRACEQSAREHIRIRPEVNGSIRDDLHGRLVLHGSPSFGLMGSMKPERRQAISAPLLE